MRITHIDQILPYIQDSPEFVVIDKGDYKVIDYVYIDKDTFSTPEQMECRGIKFDNEGIIIARPFRKFFNYGERGSDLPTHRKHIITDKLDGSMIHPAVVKGEMFLMTRKGYTDVAKKAERFAMSPDNGGYFPYFHFMWDMIECGWTPIFEFIGPKNRIVLRYEEPSLVLLAMRHIIEGHLMPYNEAALKAKEYGVPVVNVFEGNLGSYGVDAFVEHTRKLQDEEGYVVYYEDGYMVKIKAEEYVLKHRALDDLGSKKKIVALCAQGFMDDVLPILDDADKEELIDFNDSFQSEVNVLEGKVNIQLRAYDRYFTQDPVNVRKWFATKQLKDCTYYVRAACFAGIDGKDVRGLLLKTLQKDIKLVKTEWRGE